MHPQLAITLRAESRVSPFSPGLDIEFSHGSVGPKAKYIGKSSPNVDRVVEVELES
jgi:hypothetical protein